MTIEYVSVISLLQKNYPSGLIKSRWSNRVTILELFAVIGTPVPFEYKWHIPDWFQFTEDKILDFEGVWVITPTASHMLCDVIKFHRNNEVEIYIANFDLSNIFWAEINNFDIKAWRLDESL